MPVGPWGAGKSSMVRLLLGCESPQAGIVAYDEKDLAKLDVAAVRGRGGGGDCRSNVNGI